MRAVVNLVVFLAAFVFSNAATRCIDTTSTGWAGCDTTHATLALADAAASNGDTFDFEANQKHRTTAKYTGRTTSTYTCSRCVEGTKNPPEAHLLPYESTDEQGWTITATAGRNNTCQFDPGKTVYSLVELFRHTIASGRNNANNVFDSDLNGSDFYWGWHTRTDSIFDLPTSLAEGIDRVEADEGTWVQDKVAWDGTTVVYFHPRQKRPCDDTAIDLEVGSFNDEAFAFEADSITVSNLTLWGDGMGEDTRKGVGAGNGIALEWAGANSSMDNVWVLAGKVVAFGADNDCNSNSVTNTKFGAGFQSVGNGSVTCSGFEWSDVEFWGKRTSTVTWEGPFGVSSADPVILTRFTIHDAETTRRITHYDWSIDTFLQPNSNSHGLNIGSEDQRPQNITIRGCLIFQEDGLRIGRSISDVKIQNCTINGKLQVLKHVSVQDVDSIELYNTAIIEVETDSIALCNLDNCAEFLASANNAYFVHTATEKAWEEWCTAPECGDKYTVAEMQTNFGLDTNSLTEIDYSDRATHFTEPDTLHDYRPPAGSSLIDAGLNSECGHPTIVNGTCDIGAFEVGDNDSTPRRLLDYWSEYRIAKSVRRLR